VSGNTSSNGDEEEHEMEDVHEDPGVEALDLDTLFGGANPDDTVQEEEEDGVYTLTDRGIAEVALHAGYGPMGLGVITDVIIRHLVVQMLLSDRRLLERWGKRVPRTQIPPGSLVITEPPPG